MGYTIIIGKAKTDLPKTFNYQQYEGRIRNCAGKEPEGLTDPKETPTSGTPTRWPSYGGWEEFSTRWLHGFLHPESSDGYVYSLAYHLDTIDACYLSLDSMDSYNQERMRWLHFWAHEAVKRYGDKAAIQFS